jgi:hypothetical protein
MRTANFASYVAEKTRLQPFGPIFALQLDGHFEASLLLVELF